MPQDSGDQLLLLTSLFTLTWILFLGEILLFFPIEIPWLMYQLGTIKEALENFFEKIKIHSKTKASVSKLLQG